MRWTITICVALFAFPVPAPAQTLSRKPPASRKPAALSDVDGLAAVAVRNHPSLKQLAARVRQARAKVSQAKAWPDPIFSVALQSVPFWPVSFNATPMTGLQLTLTQPLPFFTKLTLAGRVARSRVQVPAAMVREARLQLAGLVRVTALELVFLAAQRDVLRRHRKLLDTVVKVSEARYRVNTGLLQDVLKARVARDRIDDRLQKNARRREAVEAALNALCGRAITTPVTTPGLPSPRRVRSTLPKLLARARKVRPVLRAWRRRIVTARLSRSLARTGYYPDFGVTVGYRFRRDSGMEDIKGMDFWSVGISVKIPLFSLARTRGRIREADAVIARERHGRQGVELQVARQVRTAFDGVRRLDKRVRGFTLRILPGARRTLSATVAAYTTGGVRFVSVLEQIRTLLRYETALWRVRVQRAQQWQRLRTAVGGTP
jgi:outer membrane protein, heavy metal efflux system